MHNKDIFPSLGREAQKGGGIGTLSERSLHRELKHYYEPNEEYHEVEFLGYIADIKSESGITEIQTRAFERLLPKLRKFLPESHVTVVLPLAREKTIRWIDKSTGEISAPRKSTKKDNIYSSFRELYKIRDFIGNKNLEVKLVFLSVDEYRYLNSKNGKRGAVRAECIIKEVLDEISITSRSDFISFLPSELNEEFTVKEFARAARLPLKRISYIISFLRIVGAIEQSGMRARAYVYKKSRIR